MAYKEKQDLHKAKFNTTNKGSINLPQDKAVEFGNYCADEIRLKWELFKFFKWLNRNIKNQIIDDMVNQYLKQCQCNDPKIGAKHLKDFLDVSKSKMQ